MDNNNADEFYMPKSEISTTYLSTLGKFKLAHINVVIKF